MRNFPTLSETHMDKQSGIPFCSPQASVKGAFLYNRNLLLISTKPLLYKKQNLNCPCKIFGYAEMQMDEKSCTLFCPAVSGGAPKALFYITKTTRCGWMFIENGGMMLIRGKKLQLSSATQSLFL